MLMDGFLSKLTLANFTESAIQDTFSMFIVPCIHCWNTNIPTKPILWKKRSTIQPASTSDAIHPISSSLFRRYIQMHNNSFFQQCFDSIHEFNFGRNKSLENYLIRMIDGIKNSYGPDLVNFRRKLVGVDEEIKPQGPLISEVPIR